MKLKKIAIFLLLIVMFNFFTQNVSIFAAINENYGGDIAGIKDDDIGSNSTILNWTAEIAYTLASAVEALGSKLLKMFTGKAAYPWIDKIIFNTVPILDINFINPANGSFFADSHGNLTIMGKMIKNVYFSVLSISVGFITLLVMGMAIKLALSSTGISKAQYKESIQQLAMCLVLVFGMHYLLSFLFFMNERLVETASVVMVSLMNETMTETIEKMEAAEDENNKKMVQNFFRENNDICFIDSIPLIGDVWNALTGFLQGIGNAIGKVWNWITGADDEEKEISKEELGKVYPSLNDYNEYFLNEDKEGNYRSTHNPKWTDEQLKLRQDVLAYLLKNKFYRKTFLKWTSGTDVNSLSEGGLGGVGRNILMSINDVVGIADTGYKSAKTVYASVAIIVHDVEVKTTENDSYDHLSDKEKEEFNKNEEAKKVNKDKNKMDSETYYVNKITTYEEYEDYVEAANQRLSDAEKIKDEKQRKVVKTAAEVDIIYANAYMKYCYKGEDKPKTQPNELITGLGDYFKGQAFYVDIDNGGWAPDYINPVATAIYAILIVQSLIMFLSYIKRFFYVIILSIMGPIVVVYDFGKGII